jgi:hypothetical protein
MRTNSNFNLFLDDIRIPSDCRSYINDDRYLDLDWLIVRSHEEFKACILENWKMGKFPNLVSFDHDLNPEHYHESMFISAEAYEIAYQNFITPTGRRSAEFLVEFCLKNNLILPECLVHTMNPAGHLRIRKTLQSI